MEMVKFTLKTKAMRVYKENSSDRGCQISRYASDNNATYILTSAYAHDLYSEYMRKHNRIPSSRWYNRHFSFSRCSGVK